MGNEPTKGTTIGWSVIVMLPALVLTFLAGLLGDIARGGVDWQRERRARSAERQSGSP